MSQTSMMIARDGAGGLAPLIAHDPLAGPVLNEPVLTTFGRATPVSYTHLTLPTTERV